MGDYVPPMLVGQAYLFRLGLFQWQTGDNTDLMCLVLDRPVLAVTVTPCYL